MGNGEVSLVGLLLGRGDEIGKVGDQVGRPIDAAQAQPGGKEAVAAMFCDKPGDALVVGLRGCGAESQSDFGQAQLEQAISPAALAVIIPLGRGPREDFDLAIIEAEAPIDGGNLRLDGARSEEHTSELQSLMRISYADFCL